MIQPGPIVIHRAVQTCWACPAQWDAWTPEGDYLYLRYRWGTGTIDDEHGNQLAHFDTGDTMGGVIDLNEFARHAGLLILDGAEH
ncbi:hypothetical protein [Streptomyces rubiginosohelvolus]|uniref:hypothetical protein n=1 Tax=Streptomyces rubiginosohelvolus TaxID=67362 RepID=UPI0036997F1C